LQLILAQPDTRVTSICDHHIIACYYLGTYELKRAIDQSITKLYQGTRIDLLVVLVAVHWHKKAFCSLVVYIIFVCIMSDFDESSEPSSGGRKRRPTPSPTSSSGNSKKARKSSSKSPGGESSKSNRGLRHFSMMVCQRVEERGTTTYNEVADELVRKVLAEREEKENGGGKFDEKNIRRRVYDALNVLMAMDIISKDKKDITWKGLPSASCRQDLDALKEEVQCRQDKVKEKREALRELLVQQVCFRNLISHNHQRGVSEEKIPLPFIVVNTHSSAVIQCDMSRDRTDVMFDFSMPFEINDDNTILKKMGL
jgi:hypothetical protein